MAMRFFIVFYCFLEKQAKVVSEILHIELQWSIDSYSTTNDEF